MLTERQLKQTHCSSASGKSHKQLDDIKFLTDDHTYRIGDHVLMKSRSRFGIVRKLITFNGGRYADVELYMTHSIDYESGIPYSKPTFSEELELVRLSRLSEPLVTAVEGPFTWFVSASINFDFSWLDEHLLI